MPISKEQLLPLLRPTSRYRDRLSGRCRRGRRPPKPLQTSIVPPGTAEDDRVLPTTKNPYFIENYFANFPDPPTPNALKLMKSRKFFTHFEKDIEIPMNFHQNQREKRRV